MLESEADYQRFGIAPVGSEGDYEWFDSTPEDDALVVCSTRASQLLADALSHAVAVDRDPKAQLGHGLQRMEKMPGLQLQVCSRAAAAAAHPARGDHMPPGQVGAPAPRQARGPVQDGRAGSGGRPGVEH